MRYAGVVEFITIGIKAMSSVKIKCVGLSVAVQALVVLTFGPLDDKTEQGAANTLTTIFGQYRHAAELTIGFQPCGGYR
jgi:hypothetical protein